LIAAAMPAANVPRTGARTAHPFAKKSQQEVMPLAHKFLQIAERTAVADD
jgi:hypothetical protein